MQEEHKKLSLNFLDGLRGLAAFYVMMGHARWLLWEGYADGYAKHPETYSLFEKALMYFITLFKFGHEAVLLFFVLSGFVIHLRYSKLIIERKDRARFDIENYIQRRVRRIFPPMLLAMLCTYLLDRYGMMQGFSIYFQQTPYQNINQNVKAAHDMLTLLGNLFFTMKILVPSWGTNAPLWSLAYEWWFYMAYPIMFFVTKKRWWLAFSIVFLLSMSTMQAGFYYELRFYFKPVLMAFLSWWFGTILADMYTGRVKIKFAYVAVFTPLAFIIPLEPFGYINPVISFNLNGLGFAGLIALCFALQEKGYQLTLLNKLKWLGDISYSLYVGHCSILVLMSGWLMSQSPDGSLPKSQHWIFVGAAITFVYAYLSYLIAEKPFLGKRKH